MNINLMDSVKTVSLHFVSILLCIVKYLTDHFIHLIIIHDDDMNTIDNNDSGQFDDEDDDSTMTNSISFNSTMI